MCCKEVQIPRKVQRGRLEAKTEIQKSEKEVREWKETNQLNGGSKLGVLLIPARTDTKYFHNYILHRTEIRFVKGRLKFGDSKNSAPFPSMVVIFRGAKA